MFIKKNYIYLLIWVISVLIAIIWTFENSDKVQLIKEKFKSNKVKIEKDEKVNSAYYSLTLKEVKTPIWSKYGGIETLNNQIIYVSGESDFFLLERKGLRYDFKNLDLKKINNNKK